jgi:hypothetical protein
VEEVLAIFLSNEFITHSAPGPSANKALVMIIHWVMFIDGKCDDDSVVAIRYLPLKLCVDNAATDRFIELISQEFIVQL